MPPMHRQPLAELIRNAVTADGRSLRQLAAESGVDHGILSRFLRGRRDITIETAQRLCDVLDLHFQARKARTQRRTTLRPNGREASRANAPRGKDR